MLFRSVPFFVTVPFVGPVAASLGNVDYSLFIGLPVAALLYWVLSRDLDLKAERAKAEAEGSLSAQH